MVNVRPLVSDKLSWYRTENRFASYGEFSTTQEYIDYCQWAEERSISIFILGNGSNTFFCKKNITTLVLLNRLPNDIKIIDEFSIEVSSTVQVMQILKYCEDRNFESFYYLASVPATVGGAVAMNAGRGGGGTIFDFVESVTIVEGGAVKVLTNAEIPRSYRTTPFSGVQENLIVSVRFRFPRATESVKGSVKTRALWSKEHQDRQLPNCGSVFKVCDRTLFRWLSFVPPVGIAIPGFRAQYSRITRNWIINCNKSPWAIMALIRMSMLVHRVLRKNIELEIVLVK